MGRSVSRQGVSHGVGHFTVGVSGHALLWDAENAMLGSMNRKKSRADSEADRRDTEGHRLVVLDRPSGRKLARVDEQQQSLRLRRQTKESRSNRPDRY
jgi:hypothetical protein